MKSIYMKSIYVEMVVDWEFEFYKFNKNSILFFTNC